LLNSQYLLAVGYQCLFVCQADYRFVACLCLFDCLLVLLVIAASQ